MKLHEVSSPAPLTPEARVKRAVLEIQQCITEFSLEPTVTSEIRFGRPGVVLEFGPYRLEVSEYGDITMWMKNSTGRSGYRHWFNFKTSDAIAHIRRVLKHENV